MTQLGHWWVEIPQRSSPLPRGHVVSFFGQIDRPAVDCGGGACLRGAMFDRKRREFITLLGGADEKDARLPIDARASLIVLAAQLQALQTMIGSIERTCSSRAKARSVSSTPTLPPKSLERASWVTSVRTRREDRSLHRRLILSQTSAG
jgi:hypothetical protein